MKNAIINIILIFVIIISLATLLPSNINILGRHLWYTPKQLIDYEIVGLGTSQQVFDRYSFSHITYGIILYYILKCLGFQNTSVLYLAIFLICLWEYFESRPFIIKKYSKRQGYENYRNGDSLINIIGDTISGIFGIYLANSSDILAISYVVISEFILFFHKASLIYLTIEAYQIINYVSTLDGDNIE